MNKKAELFNEYLEKNKIDVFTQEELDAELLYSMFDVLIHHLTESYKPLMKTIWA